MSENQQRAFELVREERLRQINEEGYTSEHDSQYKNNQLAQAAASYALDEEVRDAISDLCTPEMRYIGAPPVTWPFEHKYWKPSPDNRIKELVKAGALIVAEIERLLTIKENNNV